MPSLALPASLCYYFCYWRLLVVGGGVDEIVLAVHAYIPISESSRGRHGSSRPYIIAHGSTLPVQYQYLVEPIHSAMMSQVFFRLSQETHLSTTITMTKQVYSWQRFSAEKPLGQVDIPLVNLSSDGEECVKWYSLEPFGRLRAGGRLGRWDKNYF